MNPLVIIPARAGSKGVPGKNTKLLNGIPLISYTIRAALGVFQPEQICVTTDSPEVIQIAIDFGLRVPFIRPPELSNDTASTQKVIEHALYHYQIETPDVIILLQPTSPFRTASHIREALKLYEPKLDMIVSVKETKSNPYYVLFEENHNGYLEKSKPSNFTRRQDCPKVWEYNGAIYIINITSFWKYPMHDFKLVKKYEMDEFSSHDIDSLLDWKVAEIFAKETLFFRAI